MAFNNTLVARAAASIWGLKLGSGTMNAVLAQANANGGNIEPIINAAYNDSFAQTSVATVAAAVVANLGLTGAQATEGAAYVVAQLAGVAANQRGAAIYQIVNMFSNFPATSAYYAAATAFNEKVAAALVYSSTAGTQDAVLGNLPSGTSFYLSLGQDNYTGTAANDTFMAYIYDNSNSLQSADSIDGGAGNDTLYADMGASQTFSVTPITTNVERVAIRAQSTATDSGDNNVVAPQRVKIDAERIKGATQFESNNSRADVIIEDVRILDSQLTSDITIAMVETDPGHVDFGVYFDQYSLRNLVNTTSSINLKIMDTVAAAAGLAPLLNSNYGAFTFTITQNGVSKVVTLASKAIQDAQTYVELAAAFQAALDKEFGAGAATATVGDSFTVVDPDSKKNVTGQTVVLTTKTSTAFSTPAGSGWLAEGTAPPASNFYTNYTTGGTASSSLVTSKVILDDVGRGSTGGDLVIGGLSVGDTSSSKGVQRFEIEVRDNSKLETIASTNNTLQEVTIKNGVTSSSSTAYTTTVKDAGNLTVNGSSNTNGGNVTNGTPTAGDKLPGVTADNVYGFSDVRLIDGQTFKGKLEFSAEVTVASIAKYLNLKDPAAAQASTDNIAFTYNGGLNDDKVFVQIDGAVAGSRSTLLAGREDFTFTTNTGAGDDNITLRVVSSTGAQGGLQAWYTNQKLNKNVFVNSGDGNDTISTPGAGDKIIDAGTGNDTIYADNTGALLTASNANSQQSALASAYQADETAELNNALAVRATADTTSATLTTRLSTALNTLALAITGTTGGVSVAVTDAAVTAATTAAVAAGAITAAQKTAIDTAINTPVDAVAPTAAEIANALAIVTPLLTAARTSSAAAVAADTAAGLSPSADLTTLLNALVIGATDANVLAATAAAVIAGALTAAQKSAIDSVAGLVAGVATIAEVDAMVKLAEAALTNSTPAVNYLTTTADDLVDATTVANNAAAVVSALATLSSAIAVGTADAAVQTATTNAVLVGAITGAQKTSIDAAAVAGGAGNVDAAELAGVQAWLAPIQAAAATTATAANTAKATATTANNTAIAAVITGGAVSATSTAEATAAATALTNATTANTTAQAKVTNIAALKAALATGALDQNVLIATAAAVANGSITAGDKTALDTAATASAGSVTPVTAAEKTQIDAYIDVNLATPAAAAAAITANNLAYATAGSTIQAKESADVAAALLYGTGVLTQTPEKAVYVVNTANQASVGAGYTLVSNDERNLADLKSDVDNSYNFYGGTLRVTFKDLVATAVIPNTTSYKTTDLQINQAIKLAINSDPVLSKLLVATDGPANTLVITSLIDGVMSNANLAFAVVLPATGVLSTTDIAGAAAAYGLPATATEADVLTAMAAAKLAFDTKADYVDQLAESGAAGNNAQLTGAASVTTADNTITPGTGNDVIVLGTTVGSDALTSSNDTVVFAGTFGTDTIVHFKAGALAAGGDMLNLSSVGGNILGTAFNVNKSVNVATEVGATNGTAALVAALFTDSATAQTHVYVAVDTATNIGKVYAVVDAAGTGTGSVTATLAGTIDLADTLWASLTAENFV